MTEEIEGIQQRRSRQLRSYPIESLEDSLVIARAIYSQNAGLPMDRISLAEAVGRTPGSSALRSLVTSSARYELTDGNYNAREIRLTALGESIAGATSDDEGQNSLIEAALRPDVFRKFYESSDGKKLPDDKFAENFLRRELNIPFELAPECLSVIKQNGEYVGILKNVKGSLYVSLTAARPARKESHIEAEPREPDDGEDLPVDSPPPIAPSQEESRTPVARKIFIGHGKNKKPVEQLEKVLRQFKIPYAIAVDEPNKGRPISLKVAEIMNSCSAGILIFTCDEELTDNEGNIIWRPSENVVYELGAASMLYGEKIVIFKEEQVTFPTNFKDIGHIGFEKDKLDAKGIDLIKELIAFDLVKVTV